ncbi:putative enth domain protein [Phaeomoniella chlamydospora]|uniref:Putative enth domain protein n=1 Tax=Phaeomoniella chlamydospora TaxID=158046 RepID=A0A0G2ESG6_PHACM|nr:putative enth domain protein [Phaeomoniella chlamydospora]
MEKVVKGATKIKLAAPKSKYVEAILAATHGGEAGVGDVFRTLQHRLRDSTWTIAFKSLIVIHLMIREGEPDITLKYIAENPRQLAISNFTEVQMQGGNIRSYDNYLLERARAFRDTKTDHVRAGVGRLKRLTVDKGLLRETESVQHQIRACLKCDLLSTESDNEITLTAFRLLTMDLLVLFSVMNEGTINVLEHYFEMSRPDAERALNIYKTFSKQTDQVVKYLSIARQYELSTRLEIPKLKHAPTSLTNSLEEYLNDPDFEINRRQYLAQQQAKKSGGKVAPISNASGPKAPSSNSSFPDARNNTTAVPTKGPAPDLIDFFESIDQQNQQSVAQQAPGAAMFDGFQQQQPQPQPQPQPQQQFYQQTGFGQPNNPFGQQQTGFQQQHPQQQPANFQSSNPFGQPQPQFQPQTQSQQQQPLQPDFTGAGITFIHSSKWCGVVSATNSYRYQSTREQSFPPIHDAGSANWFISTIATADKSLR